MKLKFVLRSYKNDYTRTILEFQTEVKLNGSFIMKIATFLKLSFDFDLDTLVTSAENKIMELKLIKKPKDSMCNMPMINKLRNVFNIKNIFLISDKLFELIKFEVKQQEIMNHAKEELDKERKLLQKKRPQLEKESGAKQTKETKLLVKQGGVQNLPSPSSPSPTGGMMQAGGGGSAGGAGGSANNQVVTTSTSSSVAAAIAANSAAANNSTAGAAGQSKADDADIFVKPYSQS